jgi:hypothetical protein
VGLEGQLHGIEVVGQRARRAAVLQQLHGLGRRDVGLAHEAGRVVGADGQDGQVQRPVLAARGGGEGAVAGVAHMPDAEAASRDDVGRPQ